MDLLGPLAADTLEPIPRYPEVHGLVYDHGVLVIQLDDLGPHGSIVENHLVSYTERALGRLCRPVRVSRFGLRSLDLLRYLGAERLQLTPGPPGSQLFGLRFLDLSNCALDTRVGFLQESVRLPEGLLSRPRTIGT